MGFIKNELNEQYKYPLCHVKKIGVTQAEESEFLSENEIYTDSIGTISSIEDDSLFGLLSDCGKKSGIMKSDKINSIQSYYKYVLRHPDTNRPTYADHGVIGALLFLKVWINYKKRLDKIIDHDFGFFSDQIRNVIADLSNKIKSMNDMMNTAAEAIALHNIRKDKYNEQEKKLVKNGVLISQFHISLYNSEYPGCIAQPFAFLLRFTDELQLWDRKYFIYPYPYDSLIQGTDMDIKVTDDEISVWLKADAEYADISTPKGIFGKIYQELSKCMNVDSLLKPWDKKSNNLSSTIDDVDQKTKENQSANSQKQNELILINLANQETTKFDRINISLIFLSFLLLFTINAWTPYIKEMRVIN